MKRFSDVFMRYRERERERESERARERQTDREIERETSDARSLRYNHKHQITIKVLKLSK